MTSRYAHEAWGRLGPNLAQIFQNYGQQRRGMEQFEAQMAMRELERRDAKEAEDERIAITRRHLEIAEENAARDVKRYEEDQAEMDELRDMEKSIGAAKTKAMLQGVATMPPTAYETTGIPSATGLPGDTREYEIPTTERGMVEAVAKILQRGGEEGALGKYMAGVPEAIVEPEEQVAQAVDTYRVLRTPYESLPDDLKGITTSEAWGAILAGDEEQRSLMMKDLKRRAAGPAPSVGPAQSMDLSMFDVPERPEIPAELRAGIEATLEKHNREAVETDLVENYGYSDEDAKALLDRIIAGEV